MSNPKINQNFTQVSDFNYDEDLLYKDPESNKDIFKRKNFDFLEKYENKRFSSVEEAYSVDSHFSLTTASSKDEKTSFLRTEPKKLSLIKNNETSTVRDLTKISDSFDLDFVDNSSPTPLPEEISPKPKVVKVEKNIPGRLKEDSLQEDRNKLTTSFPKGFLVKLSNGLPQLCLSREKSFAVGATSAAETKAHIDFIDESCSSTPTSVNDTTELYGLVNDVPIQTEEPDDYEVEMLLAKQIIRNKTFYLVKWRGYSHDHNTWEPFENLENCKEMITAFNTCLFFYFKSLKSKESEDSSLTIKPRSGVINLPDNIRKFMEVLNKDNGPIITVVNDVDDEGPPVKFEYINDSVYGTNVPKPSFKNIKKHCKCKVSCSASKKSCKCMILNNGVLPYSETGLVKVPSEVPIYECSSYCGCPSTCYSRIVQRGRRVDLQVFKTINKGWGVRALKNIPKGTFVTEYVGEIITDTEADKRAKDCDGDGLNYLFDLDGKLLESLYTIDGRYKGNISHFFNHSCDPNLSVYTVFTDNQNDGLHRLAFFTIKDIKALDELCINYYGTDSIVDDCYAEPGSSREINYSTCFCGSAKCRGKFFY